MSKDYFKKNCTKVLITTQICSLAQAHAIEHIPEEQIASFEISSLLDSKTTNEKVSEKTDEINIIDTNKDINEENVVSLESSNKILDDNISAIEAEDKETGVSNNIDDNNAIEISNENEEKQEVNLKEENKESVNDKSNIENNWLNLEVAKLVGKEYTELTKEDYESITRITVRKKNVTGSIPKDIGKMTNLEFIDFSENKITGEIPKEIGNLTNLKTLWLADNELTGSIPDEFYTLTQLESVVLRDNNLEGCLKEDIKNLKHMVNLTIRGNSIGGKLPDGLYELTELRTLDIRNNKFEGIISSKIGNLSKLEVVYINDNVFVGEMPTELLEILCNNVSNANNFYISFNQMIGTATDRFIQKFTGRKFNGTMVKGAEVPLRLSVEEGVEINVDVYNKVDLNEIRKYVTLELNDGASITKQKLNDYYNLELIPEVEGLINNDGYATKSGTVKAKVKIKESTIDNPNTITERTITININPLKISHTLSNDKWTNQDVDIKLNFQSDSVKKVILPNNKETSDKDVVFRVDKNGEYKFTVIDILDNKYEYFVEVKNIHKEKPVIENKEELVEVKDDTITIDISNIIALTGLYKIILPNGEEIINPTETIISFTVPRNGIYRIIVIDNAGNNLHVDVPVDTLKDDGSESEDNSNNESVLPETGGLFIVNVIVSCVMSVIGLFLIRNNRKKK